MAVLWCTVTGHVRNGSAEGSTLLDEGSSVQTDMTL